MGYRVVVDFDLCESNARCMEAAPEVFEVRDDDFLYVLDETPPDELRPKVEEAVRRCPKAAITIVDDLTDGETARSQAIVVVGASLAGLRAAEELRCEGFDGTHHGRRRRAARALRPPAPVQAGARRRTGTSIACR